MSDDADSIARALLDGLKADATNLPDHPIRQAEWYQLYVRLARPTLTWIANLGAIYGLFLGHVIVAAGGAGAAWNEGYAAISFGFIALIHGLGTVERVKRVA